MSQHRWKSGGWSPLRVTNCSPFFPRPACSTELSEIRRGRCAARAAFFALQTNESETRRDFRVTGDDDRTSLGRLRNPWNRKFYLRFPRAKAHAVKRYERKSPRKRRAYETRAPIFVTGYEFERFPRLPRANVIGRATLPARVSDPNVRKIVHFSNVRTFGIY